MAEGGAGHLHLRLPGPIVLIQGRQGLLGLVVGHIEEFEGVFDIVGPFTEVDEIVIMEGLVEQVLGLFKFRGPRPILLDLLEGPLSIGDSLARFILGLCEKILPLSEGFVVSLAVTGHAGFP